MYYAKIPFTENVTVIRLKCFEHRAPLPSYTKVRFEDNVTQIHYTLTFRDNVCAEKPDIATQLPGKKAELSGMQSWFGKFYNTIVPK